MFYDYNPNEVSFKNTLKDEKFLSFFTHFNLILSNAIKDVCQILNNRSSLSRTISFKLCRKASFLSNDLNKNRNYPSIIPINRCMPVSLNPINKNINLSNKYSIPPSSLIPLPNI